jgi:flagellar biosynthesis/type III secretory pathway protein FliH
MIAEAEPLARALALEVAGRVIGRAVEADPVAVATAERALRRARLRRRLTLRAHPGDLEALRQALPRLQALVPSAEQLAVAEDPSVKRGGLYLETEAGEIDARVETQLGILAAEVGAE